MGECSGGIESSKRSKTHKSEILRKYLQRPLFFRGGNLYYKRLHSMFNVLAPHSQNLLDGPRDRIESMIAFQFASQQPSCFLGECTKIGVFESLSVFSKKRYFFKTEELFQPQEAANLIQSMPFP